jgi:hypothetical protein
MIKVICQICQEEIAIIKPEVLIRYPLSGSMFTSIEPERGIPSPFQPADTWELFKCPYGPHRPMVRPDQILTSEGILNVPKNGAPHFYGQIKAELDRTDVFDREMDVPPVMTEEQAEALVRAQMGETTKVEVVENGEADTRQGQPEDEKPIESKEEESKTDGKQDIGTGAFVCEQCKRGFKNLSGLNNHRRFKHK